MEKFDLAKFTEKKLKKSQAFITDDSEHVSLFEYPDSFQKDIRKDKSPIKTSKVYFKESLQLKKEGNFFHGFPVGIHRSYNKDGNIVEEIDFDAQFSFSLDSLQKKIKDIYGRNIQDIEQKTGVWRSIHPYPHYIISIPLSENPRGDLRKIKVNGETGEIELETISKYTQ